MEKQEIFDIILNAVTSVSPFANEILSTSENGFGWDLCFVDLGINSIDYAEIVYSVMTRLDVDLPLDAFANTNNICEAVDIFYDLVEIPAAV